MPCGVEGFFKKTVDSFPIMQARSGAAPVEKTLLRLENFVLRKGLDRLPILRNVHPHKLGLNAKKFMHRRFLGVNAAHRH